MAKGNSGRGTSENLDGEIIILAEVIWQVPTSAQVRRVGSDARRPFAWVVFFALDLWLTVILDASLEDLTR